MENILVEICPEILGNEHVKRYHPMKKLATVLLAAAALFSACGAAPDTTPLATPTPDPAAAAEPTPEPQNGEFYALERSSSTFNSGDAYYEFAQKLGYCL